MLFIHVAHICSFSVAGYTCVPGGGGAVNRQRGRESRRGGVLRGSGGLKEEGARERPKGRKKPVKLPLGQRDKEGCQGPEVAMGSMHHQVGTWECEPREAGVNPEPVAVCGVRDSPSQRSSRHVERV